MVPLGRRADGPSPSCADGRGLLGQVDADRAPGDAAAAADAARGVELVPPGRQLVGQPLPVARRGRGPHRPTVQVGVVEVEARRPGPLAADRRRPGRWCRTRRCRSRSGRPGCSCRRPGTARPPRPSEDARGCGPAARPGRRSRVGAHRSSALPSRGPAARSARSLGVGSRPGRAEPAPPPRARCRPGRRSGDRARRRARSAPGRSRPAAGPVPIDVQKHVAAGVPHSAATTKAPAASGGVAGIGHRRPRADPVEHVERGQFAGSGTDDGHRGGDSRLRRRARDAVAVDAWPATPPVWAGRTRPSRTPGRRPSRTPPRRRRARRRYWPGACTSWAADRQVGHPARPVRA